MQLTDWLNSWWSPRMPSRRRSRHGMSGRESEVLEHRNLMSGSPVLIDIAPGATPSYPERMENINGTLFFVANDGASGPELWKSDGTPAGTALVRDIRAGAAGSWPTNFTNLNGTLYFTANDGVSGEELWKSDGTVAGTVRVTDINPGSASSTVISTRGLANLNGTLFFAADDGIHGIELWKSDGTAAGTSLVKDIFPGTSKSNSSAPSGLTNVNGTLFFSANTNTAGRELWKSDGTANGTVQIKDINPGPSNSDPNNFTALNGTLYFVVYEPTYGQELWKTDGTASGTMIAADIRPGSAGSGVQPPTVFNGQLFFLADDGVHGREPWRSNGTAAGSALVGDLFPGASSSDASSFAVHDGHLYFGAFEALGSRQLWQSDGTTLGTIALKNLAPELTNPRPTNLVSFNDQLIFAAESAAHGYELWALRTQPESSGSMLSIVSTNSAKSEGSSGTTELSFTVSRSGSTSSSASVDYSVIGVGTNRADHKDFGGALPSGTINFAAGESSKTLTINVSGDSIAESDDTFAVRLSNPKGAALDSAATNLVINGDFEAGNSNFSSSHRYRSNTANNLYSAGDYTVTADPRFVHDQFARYPDHTPGSGTFMLVANGATTPVTVWGQTIEVVPNTTYQFSAYGSTTVVDTATLRFEINGVDVGTLNVPAVTGQWTPFSANWNSGSATTADLKIINLSVASNGNDFALDDIFFGTSTGIPAAFGIILNDDTNDASLSIAATNASRLEGNSGNTAFTFTVTRTGNTSGTASANFAVTGSGTNLASASDFSGSLPTGTISFEAGETTKTLTINVSGDTAVEPNEGFTVTLSNVVGASLGTASATGTIRNDDSSLSIAATSASNSEGDSGTTPFTFTVTRIGTISGTASVDYAVTGSGTNTADATDFGGALPSGTINFAATETTKTITINVAGDSTKEGDEGFTIALSNPSGANIGTASADGTIRNDDAVSTLTIGIDARAELNRGNTPFVFSVSRTGDSSGAASATFTVAAGGSRPADAADFGGSFPTGTVSFAAGETSQKITVSVSGDTDFEAEETFEVTLSNPIGTTLGTNSIGRGYIRNDDVAPIVIESSTQTFVVDTLVDENDGNFAPGDLSLREAIDRANSTSGTQTITFAPQLTESGPATIKLGGTNLVIVSSMIIDGPGADRLTIDADRRSRIFAISDGLNPRSTVVIRGLTLANGMVTGNTGGAIDNRETLIVERSTIRDSSATFGGGISNADGDLTVIQSTLTGNSARDYGGGIHTNGGTLTVVQSTINGNSVVSFGGGVFAAAATVVISQSTFTDNDSATFGGAIEDSYSDTTIDQSTIVGNRAGHVGGGIHNGSSGFLTLKNSIVVGNTGSETFKLHDLVTNSVTNLTAVSNLIGSPKIDENNTLGASIHGVNGNILGASDGRDGRTLLDASTIVSTVLTDLGGPTKVLPLLPGSLAIDAGSLGSIPTDRRDSDADGNSVEAVSFDQRGNGFARVTGSQVDLGAMEFGSTNALALTTNELANVLLDESGKLRIRDLDTGGRADQLTVSFDAGSQELVIRDPQNILRTSIGTIVTAQEIRVARAAITGNGLRVELNGGADQIDLSQLPAGLLTVEVDGGDGNDTIIGHAGADLILGGRGNDSISAGDGNDTLSGGDGNDVLRGDAGHDVLRGQMNNDRLFGGEGDDTGDGGGGDDSLSGDNGNDSLMGSTGNDALSGGDGRDKIIGGDGHDSLGGGSGNDQLNGGNGNDSIDGGAGNDFAEGQAGNDLVNGSAGDDTLQGGFDNDTLIGLSGHDRLDGGDGNDVSKGGEGNDTLLGGNGNDNLSGSVGDDVEEGGEGADTLAGGDGNDSLAGGEGNDYVHGDAGEDSLDGGAGQDEISFDLGSDILVDDDDDILL